MCSVKILISNHRAKNGAIAKKRRASKKGAIAKEGAMAKNGSIDKIIVFIQKQSYLFIFAFVYLYSNALFRLKTKI